jgi:hypothetical protein
MPHDWRPPTGATGRGCARSCATSWSTSKVTQRCSSRPSRTCARSAATSGRSASAATPSDAEMCPRAGQLGRGRVPRPPGRRQLPAPGRPRRPRHVPRHAGAFALSLILVRCSILRSRAATARWYALVPRDLGVPCERRGAATPPVGPCPARWGTRYARAGTARSSSAARRDCAREGRRGTKIRRGPMPA